MRVEGKTGDFILLQEIISKNDPIFQNLEASSLSVLWFREDNSALKIDGKEYAFEKNQLVFLTEFHQVEIIELREVRFLRFNRPFFCVIDHDSEVGCKGLLFFGASQLPIITIPAEELARFQILWKMFSLEMESKDSLQIEMLQMMLKRYLILCTRLYKQQHKMPQPKFENDLIREFNFLVEQHYHSKHTVAEYAELLNKSPKTISNTFAKLGSKTPLSYIHERRMMEARRLLSHTELQINEIAFQIGYEDLQTFSRFFKKQEGLSPSQFREKLSVG